MRKTEKTSKAPLAASQQQEYDAIVVGSGVTGGWAAKELCEKGLKVLLLERGRPVTHGEDYVTEHVPPWEMPYRGLGDQRNHSEEYQIQSQAGPFNAYNKHFFVNDNEHPYVFDEDQPFLWIRGYHLGGRSLTWGRQCYRWSDLDFEANAREGVAADWPIRYQDIAPWYRYAEQFVGISGSAEGLPQLPDGAFLPPMEMNCAERSAKGKIEQAYQDRMMTIGRAAILTDTHNGRAPCHYCGPCSRGCSTGSYFSSLASTIPAAQATGNLTIQCNSVVRNVLYDDQQGRASGVRVVDRESKEVRDLKSRLVFLCASTLGSTQILLNSTSRRFPNGMGNSSGVLGHFLMDHHFKVGAVADLPGFEDQYYYGNRPNGIYIPRFRNLEPGGSRNVDFLRGYGYQGGAYRESWGRGTNASGFGEGLKHRLRQPGGWRMNLTGFGEMLPRYENYVELADETDDWGMPLLRFHCSIGENEEQMRQDMREQAAEMLEAAGGTNVTPYTDTYAPGEGIHEMGTARMGNDPSTSVLNKWNQAHEVPNLFVTDGSCMTSAACQNPSITYMALTARAADYAVKEMKRGNL